RDALHPPQHPRPGQPHVRADLQPGGRRAGRVQQPAPRRHRQPGRRRHLLAGPGLREDARLRRARGVRGPARRAPPAPQAAGGPRDGARVLMQRVRGRPALVGVAAVAAVAWPFFTSKTIHFYGALSAIYALVALSLVILAGWTGQVSLGHAAFLGFGVYIGQKMLSAGVPVLLAVVVVAAFGAAISLVLGIPSLRLRGVYLTIVTLAFGAACQHYFFLLESIRGFHSSTVPRPSVFGLSTQSDRG